MIMPLELKKMTAASPDQHAIYDGGLAKARLGYSPRVAQLGGQGAHTARVGGYIPWFAQLGGQGTHITSVRLNSLCKSRTLALIYAQLC